MVEKYEGSSGWGPSKASSLLMLPFQEHINSLQCLYTMTLKNIIQETFTNLITRYSPRLMLEVSASDEAAKRQCEDSYEKYFLPNQLNNSDWATLVNLCRERMLIP